MNTSPLTMQINNILAGTTGAAETATDGGESSAFTTALAAAAASGVMRETDKPGELLLPEDMPSAAALAFLAQLFPDAPLPDASAGGLAEGIAPGAGGGAPQGNAAQAALALLGGQVAVRAAQVAGTPGQDGAHPDGALPMQDSQATDALDLEALAGALRMLSGGTGGRADSAAQPALLTDAGTTPLYGPVREPLAHTSALPAQAAVHAPVGTPRWADEIGQHMIRMSLRGQQEGSLTLSPDHLGPVEVRISIDRDSAQVWFGAQHAETRAALSEALPRLRELFADAGMSLGEAGVSHEMPRQNARPAEHAARASQDAPAEIATQQVQAPARRVASALLDAWA